MTGWCAGEHRSGARGREGGSHRTTQHKYETSAYAHAIPSCNPKPAAPAGGARTCFMIRARSAQVGYADAISDGSLTNRNSLRPACNGGRRRILWSCAALTLALAVAACAPSGHMTPTRAARSATASPVPSSAATSDSPSATPAATAPDPLAGCRPSVPYSSLPVLARLPAADDVAVEADGSLWVDDASRTLVHFSATGTVLQRITDPRVPEGIAMLPDGSLLLAEQGADRVVHLAPATEAFTTVVQLTPRAGQAGVDGIAYDAASNTVLVPDSPNGTLLQVPAGGGAPVRLASGLGRPVGAALASDGSVIVAAEDARGVLRVPAGGGTALAISDVTQADDVMVANGVAYVTSLTAHQLIAVDLASARTHVLVTGDSMPQGLALRPGGDLVLTDSATGTVVVVPAC